MGISGLRSFHGGGGGGCVGMCRGGYSALAWEQGLSILPQVTPSGSHHTYGRHVDGTHATGMHSCFISFHEPEKKLLYTDLKYVTHNQITDITCFLIVVSRLNQETLNVLLKYKSHKIYS